MSIFTVETLVPDDVHVIVYALPTVICSPPFGEVIVKIGAATAAVVVAVLLAVVVTAGVAETAGVARIVDTAPATG